jgi:hypothetical protein
MELHYLEPSTLPRRYEIAWCRFPLEANGHPGSKLRPVLVRATKCDMASNRTAIVASYGTTNLKIGRRDRIDLVIQNAAQLDRLGLPHATRFDLDVMQLLPWAHEFFAPPPHAETIVTGILDEEQINRFLAKLRRREAERSRATEA